MSEMTQDKQVLGEVFEVRFTLRKRASVRGNRGYRKSRKTVRGLRRASRDESSARWKLCGFRKV